MAFQTFLGVDLPWSELHTGRINANTIVSSESLDASSPVSADVRFRG